MPSDVAPTDVPSPAQAAPAAASPTGASPSARTPLPDDRERLQELRQLLLGEDQAAFLDRWREIAEEKVDAGLLSDVLPDAVRLRSRLDAERGDSALGDALAPAIEEGIQASVARNPQPLVDAIFPIIGPAIRRAIQQALASSLQSVNQAVEYGLTWRGLRWRIEAWRSGLSIGEVALRDTLRYRVEQVFLIHTETSLLLRHAALPGLTDAGDDADLVSGMLSAVQTFVRDSFHVDDTEALDALQMGDLTVWLVPGPEAVLAAVIRGTPPQELRLLLAEGIEALHRRHARDLAAFDGDVQPYEAADPVLYDLLVEQRKQDTSVSPMAWVLLALVAVLLGWWGWTTFDRMQRWQATLADLDALEGLDVITEERTWGAYRLVGLRDPDAPLPDSVLALHGFADEALADSLDANAVRMRWLPYLSDAPSIVAARAARMLDAPSSVAFAMRGDTLVGTGTAPRPWMTSLPEALRFVPNVRALDLAEVQTRTEAAAFPVETTSIRFASEGVLASGQDAALNTLVYDVQALAEAAVDDDQPIVLSIIGHTDGTGTAARNQRLSLLRAAVVRDVLAPVLADAGLSNRVTLRLVAARDAFRLEDGASLQSRRVTFEVETEPATGT